MAARTTAGRSRRPTPRPNESTAQTVARHVRALIFDGELHPGQRLPQDDIADDLGISRIPVREAIIALEREGWLRVEPHRGAFVLPLDETAVIDRFALYGRFYGFAAGRAIERMEPDELATLTGLAAKVAAARTIKAMDTANTRYFATLVSIAASSRLESVMRSIDQIVPGNFFAAVPDSMVIQQRGVAELQAAIEARDPAAAERATDEMDHDQALAVIAMMNERRAARSRS